MRWTIGLRAQRHLLLLVLLPLGFAVRLYAFDTTYIDPDLSRATLCAADERTAHQHRKKAVYFMAAKPSEPVLTLVNEVAWPMP